MHAGTNIYQDAGSGTFSSLFSGMTSGAIPQYSTFKDLMITGNDSTADVPKSWDGSTAQNLAGTPQVQLQHQSPWQAMGCWQL